MYYVIINNHKTGIQKVIDKTVYVDVATNICEETAIDIVLKIKGTDYRNEVIKNMNLRKKRNILPQGYTVLRSKSAFPKYTVVYKEPNGYLSYGNIKKIYSIFAVKIPGSILPKIPELAEPSLVDNSAYDNFLFCLLELKEKLNEELPELEDSSDSTSDLN